MIPKECKRLAEVDFPIAVVSKHSAREKSIRHGHPSTLHLWWARRPLAACRAMLMALLLPDPCDPNCPKEFINQASDILLNMRGRPSSWGKALNNNEGLRKVILQFIGDFSDWDNSANPAYLDVSRALIKAVHPDETPLVVDPFAGGGSIPLEALRLGCEAFASDLNPVACLINKVMLEDIPRHGRELAEELRRVGGEIKKQAEKELAKFYPKDPDGSTPIAYLWTRTVKCESPNCGAEIPLMRSFWLCKKANRKKALKLKVVRLQTSEPKVEFEIFEPKTEKDIQGGTVSRAKATCPCCHMVLSPERVRAQLAEQHGGADVIFDKKGIRTSGARILAVVTLMPGIQGRNYRLPLPSDYHAIFKAQQQLKGFLDNWKNRGQKGFSPLPDEPLPWIHGHRSIGSLRVYGMKIWGDLFSSRQNLALATISKHINELPEDSVARILTLAFSKLAELSNSLCPWEPFAECPRHVFARHDLPMAWDFAEGVPISSSSGSFETCYENVSSSFNSIYLCKKNATVQIGDARQSMLPSASANIWFTDPPYYDAVAYSDLSDLFYVWIKRTIPTLADGINFKNGLTPKEEELTVSTVADIDAEPKDKAFFEQGISKAFFEGRRILNYNDIATVVFAHKTTEGWESLLSGAIQAGWTITASWPIATEMGSRLNARDTASLSSSVHLVCRPRSEDAPVGDWADVLRELPNRVGNWMERLQSEHVRGADLVFACIGPALEIFSRYRRVETPDGQEVTLAKYLVKVWEVVGRIALEQILGTAEARARNGMAGALEEDARLTALFLWTLQSTNGAEEGKSKKAKGKKEETDDSDLDENENDDDESPKGKTKGYSLVFDVVRRFAQPLGINLPKWEDRIIETTKGVVRLMAVSERAKQIFGASGIETAIEELLAPTSDGQMTLPGFQELVAQKKQKTVGRGKKIIIEDPGEITTSATTLDRVHAAMLLQASGQANALRMLIKAEQDRGPDFLRLANALSALYPVNSEEKRLLDAMLLAVPR